GKLWFRPSSVTQPPIFYSPKPRSISDHHLYLLFAVRLRATFPQGKACPRLRKSNRHQIRKYYSLKEK
ncbi:MAG: hypothetical protein UH734_04215, partial [Ruminococcus sp.]|nr:hypothetical protein [Ruminococcus sp.]